MTPLLVAAAEAQQFLHGRGERFCFIGGLAVQRWGEPRFTRDVDLTLLCELGLESRAVDLVLSGFRPRVPDARQFALRHRVILIETGSGFPIDVALGALPFELVRGELEPLLALREAPERLDQLEQMRNRLK